MDEGEDSCVGPYTKGEREYCHDGEAGSSKQLAHAIVDVLRNTFGGGFPGGGVGFVSNGLDAAHFGAGRGMGVLRIDAAADFFCGMGFLGGAGFLVPILASLWV